MVTMMLYLLFSFMELFFTFSTIYIVIQDDIRKKHSKTYIRKNQKGIIDKLLFLSFKKEIKWYKYYMLIACYLISFFGIVLGAMNILGIVSDTGLICKVFVYIMVVSLIFLFYLKVGILPVMESYESNQGSIIKVIIILATMVLSVISIIFILMKIFRIK